MIPGRTPAGCSQRSGGVGRGRRHAHPVGHEQADGGAHERGRRGGDPRAVGAVGVVDRLADDRSDGQPAVDGDREEAGGLAPAVGRRQVLGRGRRADERGRLGDAAHQPQQHEDGDAHRGGRSRAPRRRTAPSPRRTAPAGPACRRCGRPTGGALPPTRRRRPRRCRPRPRRRRARPRRSAAGLAPGSPGR